MPYYEFPVVSSPQYTILQMRLYLFYCLFFVFIVDYLIIKIKGMEDTVGSQAYALGLRLG